MSNVIERRFFTFAFTGACLAAALLFTPAYAQDAAPAAAPAPMAAASASSPKIAVLNVQEIMRDSLAAKSVKEQFDKKQKTYSSEIKSKEEALQKEKQELDKQRTVLAQDAFQKKVQEFNTKATAVQKEVQAKRVQLDKGLNAAFGDIQKTVTVILTDMAKERGFTMVVPTQQILYSDPQNDVTVEVMKRLNAKLSSVAVKF